MDNPIIITKTPRGILATLGIVSKTKKEVFKISQSGVFYNSTLGNFGTIQSELIAFIELGKLRSSQVIKIGLKDEYKVKFKYQLKKFGRGMSELYYKETGAEILIFPQDTDTEISELAQLMKDKLNK